jgi:pimeloyl-ACP methyl ester carboxylesterase
VHRLYTLRQYGQHHNQVVIFLAGWKTRQWLYWLPAQRLARRGYRCLAYTYDDEVFSPDVERTVKSLQEIKAAVLKQIETLQAVGCDDIALVGFSLGTMLAMMVADESPAVSRVVLNLTGTSPADAVWTWDVINPPFKQALTDQGISLTQLSETWAPLAPSNRLAHLEGKQLLVYLAVRDKVIPHDQGIQLVTEMERLGYKPTVITNAFGGHTIAGIYNLIRIRSYARFLDVSWPRRTDLPQRKKM